MSEIITADEVRAGLEDVSPLELLGDELLSLDVDELRALCVELDADQLAIVERAISYMTGNGWRSDPLTMAEYLTRAEPVNERLKAWRYSRLLGQQFVKAVEGTSKRQIWNLPARYGKTKIGSQWGPVWCLDRYPWLRLILTSYGDQLARENAGTVRDLLEQHHAELRVQVRRDRRARGGWRTSEGGMVLAAGVGSAMTGYGGNVIVVDDPFKNWVEAHSETTRDNVWNWYRSVVRTRLQTDESSIIVIMCMTGETPVLMANGHEKPLSDVRPGDRVATYENGQLTTSVVRNWASQGPDTVYSLRMKSGVIVRANARHPFLTVDEHGAETWRQLQELSPGDAIVRATRPEEAWSDVSAPSTGAIPPPSARACACRTTAGHDGRRATGHPPPTQSRGDASGSKGATGSRPRRTTSSLPSKVGAARSVDSCPEKSTGRSTGPRSSASTTTTTQGPCEVCSATTAISSSGAVKPPPFFVPPLSTWRVEADEILAITESGVDEVYDLQIDRTENFIANGLTSHNTRWHEDDLTGRLLNPPDGEGEAWELVVLPAIAEPALAEVQSVGFDLDTWRDRIGRAAGEVLEPERFSDTAVHDRHKALGSYLTAGMEQQRPAPAEGGIIKRAWWRYYGALPAPMELTDWLISWDSSFKDATSSDFVVGGVWCRWGSRRFLIDMVRDRMDYPTFKKAVVNLARRWPQARRILIEDSANGPAVIADLRVTLTGLTPRTAKGSKLSRVHAVSSDIESGTVWIPDPNPATSPLAASGRDYSWVNDYVNEHAAFPNGSHDDMVDMTSQALLEFDNEMAESMEDQDVLDRVSALDGRR